MSSGKMTIKTLHGKIYDSDSVGSIEMFVRVMMGDQSDESSIETKGKNQTIFDFTACFQRSHEDKANIELWAKKGDGDCLIGKGTISLNPVVKSHKWTDWVELKNHGKTTAEVYCDVSFLPDKEKELSPSHSGKHHHGQMIQNY